ncbi:hypothetical protein CDD80_4130 [Ophiocordyceps camponoti-rufipedis]|uniref:Uncharacterized protein n=1 Tax=Ophiocordyceps camponoti-rufipedis TaxID=2004952 RepID=A0A2C5ZCN3_9HYPO|nr:hypothetical protein CDD80_4130 [Ophiocordyceps camponoti-rufipedis]
MPSNNWGLDGHGAGRASNRPLPLLCGILLNGRPPSHRDLVHGIRYPLCRFADFGNGVCLDAVAPAPWVRPQGGVIKGLPWTVAFKQAAGPRTIVIARGGHRPFTTITTRDSRISQRAQQARSQLKHKDASGPTATKEQPSHRVQELTRHVDRPDNSSSSSAVDGSGVRHSWLAVAAALHHRGTLLPDELTGLSTTAQVAPPLLRRTCAADGT